MRGRDDQALGLIRITDLLQLFSFDFSIFFGEFLLLHLLMIEVALVLGRVAVGRTEQITATALDTRNADLLLAFPAPVFLLLNWFFGEDSETAHRT